MTADVNRWPTETGAIELFGGIAVLVPRTANWGATLLLLVDVGAFLTQVGALHLDWVHTIVIGVMLTALVRVSRNSAQAAPVRAAPAILAARATVDRRSTSRDQAPRGPATRLFYCNGRQAKGWLPEYWGGRVGAKTREIGRIPMSDAALTRSASPGLAPNMAARMPLVSCGARVTSELDALALALKQ